VLHEYVAIANYTIKIRRLKQLSKLAHAMSKALENAWQTFAHSLKWVVSATLHVRAKSVVQQLVVAMLARCARKAEALESSSTGVVRRPVGGAGASGQGSGPPIDFDAIESKLPPVPVGSAVVRASKDAGKEPSEAAILTEAMLALFHSDPILRRLDECVAAQEWALTQLLNGGFRGRRVVSKGSASSLGMFGTGVATLLSTPFFSSALHPTFASIFATVAPAARIAYTPGSAAPHSHLFSASGAWAGANGIGGWCGATTASFVSSEQNAGKALAPSPNIIQNVSEN
jgi:hypothetical protein